MGWIAVQGAIIAGAYGIVHDQITYSISREYFTVFKVDQFQYMNFGWPERVYAGQVGFMATWWVGFIAGWFLARLTVPHLSREQAGHWCRQAFVVLVGVVLAAGLVGAVAGWWQTTLGGDLGEWQTFARAYGVHDVPAFTRAAYIHNGSYLGALLGLVGACFWTRRRVRGADSAGINPIDGAANADGRTL